MKIVLTGCAGFVGSRLAPRLKALGHAVVGIDRAEPSAAVPLDTFIRADLLDADEYSQVLASADLICHLAAAKGDWGISEAEYERDNGEATRVLLDAAHRQGARRWIFYSTVSALGPSEIPIPEDSPRRPTNPYGRSKAKCEELFERYMADVPEAQVVNIRPSVVYGPHNPWNTNIFRLIDAVWRNRFVMIGRGEQVKTTSYIDHLLDAHLFLMTHVGEHERGFQTWHYVDAPALSMAELVSEIYALLGKRRGSLRVPLAIASPLALIGDATATLTGIDLPITSARVRKFCTATNFGSQKIRDAGFVQRWSNEQALRATVDWYLNEYVAKRRPEAERHAALR